MQNSKKEQILSLYENKQIFFDNLEICKKCTQVVFGDGNPDSSVVFVGEAPGRDEDIQGVPFVGRAGKLLTQTLAEIGIERKSVYITNIVKCRPPENRDPTIEELSFFSSYLTREIEIINPSLVVTLGRFSMYHFINWGKSVKKSAEIADSELIFKSSQENTFEFPNVKISSLHGKLIKLSESLSLFPMYHPAAALRATNVLNEFKRDFAKLKLVLEKLKAAI